jgi:LysM repeat protein
MKNFVFLLFFLPLLSNAQVSHTVAAKESLYSLARKYNVHPRELAAYNNIPIETPLALGQVIKIPAKKTMAPLGTPPPVQKEEPVVTKPAATKVEVKTEKASNKQGSFPVYHKVQKKETLYFISKLYPGATIADIKKWNKLEGDGLSEGTDLIVGYSDTRPATAATPEPVKETPSNPVVTKTAPVVKEPEVKKEEPVVKEEPVKKEVVKKETPKEEVRNVTGKNFNGGAFKNLYEQQASAKKSTAEEKGPAGIFKSTSGWEDGKYYCLTNTAPAGTIVKVTNNATQRSVYAKVLDLIPDLKQNTGMVIRISNAAAEELGASGDSFDCTLTF